MNSAQGANSSSNSDYAVQNVAQWGSDFDMQLAIQTMLRSGWCVHQVRYLAKTFDAETLSYFSRLQRSPKRLESHKDCLDKTSCIAYNVDMVNYKTRHIRDDCNCEMVFVPYDELVNIIRKGYVPLITIEMSPGSTSEIKLKLHRRRSAYSYTAISHVWADGLGNPKGNGLPSCQLHRFRHEAPFWMDTLCIPVKKEHEVLKMASIASMASIYAGARSVVVLDTELMATNVDTKDCLARVICSTWMRRSWTLQEGLLPQECKILFANRTLIFGSKDSGGSIAWEDSGRVLKLRARHSSVQSNAINTTVWDNLKVYLEDHFFGMRKVVNLKEEWQTYILKTRNFEAFARMEALEPGEQPPTAPSTTKYQLNFAYTFVSVWNALAGRSTTKSEDLYLILANILDMECGPLLNLETPEERLRTIIFNLPRIPLSLCFDLGPKFNSHIYPLNRWMPLELTQEYLDQGSTLENLVDFDHSHTKCCKTHFMKLHAEEDITCILVGRVVPPDRGQFGIQISGTNKTFTVAPICPQHIPNSSPRAESTCIIIERDVTKPGVKMRGALFYVTSHQNNSTKQTVQLVFHCPVQVHAASDPQDTHSVYSTYTANRIAASSEILIQYNCMPFPNLKQHDMGLLNTGETRLIVIHFLVLYVLVFTLGISCALNEDGTIHESKTIMLILVLILSTLILLTFILFFIHALSEPDKHHLWRYVQSFEHPARRRRTRPTQRTDENTGYGTFRTPEDQV